MFESASPLLVPMVLFHNSYTYRLFLSLPSIILHFEFCHIYSTCWGSIQALLNYNFIYNPDCYNREIIFKFIEHIYKFHNQRKNEIRL